MYSCTSSDGIFFSHFGCFIASRYDTLVIRICWFSIPFSLATSLGLASTALMLPINSAEAGAGLVPPAVANELLGGGCHPFVHAHLAQGGAGKTATHEFPLKSHDRGRALHGLHDRVEAGEADAVQVHVGAIQKRKEARLKFIRAYWMDRLKDIPNVVINTPNDNTRACGIGNVGLKNMKPTEMAERLLANHKIWTVGIEGQSVFGCRITPNIYTSTTELDAFVAAVKTLATS